MMVNHSLIKRFLLLLLTAALLFSLCGCDFRRSSVIVYSGDSVRECKIEMGHRYVLDWSRPYDNIHNDDGSVDLVIHFTPRKAE